MEEDAFDGLREQSNVCFNVPMKRGLMALVRGQTKALDFKRIRGGGSSAILKSTSYAYRCEFGVPCDCSQGMTAGDRLHTPSVVVWASLAAAANHPWTFRPAGVGVDRGVCSSS